MHATPRNKDPRYNHDREQTTIPLTLHRADGTTADIDLVLDPDQVELYWAQLDRLINRREKCRMGELA